MQTASNALGLRAEALRARAVVQRQLVGRSRGRQLRAVAATLYHNPSLGQHTVSRSYHSAADARAQLITGGDRAGALAPPSQRTTVRFWLKFHVDYGQSLRVLGGSATLGAWDINNALDMVWSEGDLWSVEVPLTAGAVYEYKYVIMQGGQPINWQRGANNVLALQLSDTEVEVYDNWRNTPGAVVLVDGAETTRERKLMSWAGDVSRQGAELARAKAELAQARDEVRLLRAEMSVMRLEVNEAALSRRDAEQRAAALDIENQALRLQLSSVHASASAAMREAARLLDVVPPEQALRKASNAAQHQPGQTPKPQARQQQPPSPPAAAASAAAAGARTTLYAHSSNGNGASAWRRS